MDLRELECLVAVADTGGVTRAAESLGLSQPAVSGALRKLEREVGEALVERVGRGVRLTAAGRAAVVPARGALAAVAEVGAAVAGLSGLLRGGLRLGHVGSGATTTLLGPLTAFHAAHPGVEVSLVEDSSDLLARALLEGRLDLAWVAVAGPLPDGLAGRGVLDEAVVAAVAADHPWAGRASVPLAALVGPGGPPLVAMPVGTGARAALDAACAGASTTPRIAFEVAAPDLVGRLVAAGHGVGVLAAPLAAALGLVAVPVSGVRLRSRLVLAWRTGGPVDPAARAFLEVVGSSGEPGAGP